MPVRKGERSAWLTIQVGHLRQQEDKRLLARATFDNCLHVRATFMLLRTDGATIFALARALEDMFGSLLWSRGGLFL